jgi:poly(3-hydroxybutyrate) depolymerase
MKSWQMPLSGFVRTLLPGACSAAIGLSAAVAAPVRLPTLGIDELGISVSGVSAGAYMAVQFHVAFSDDVMGAGVVAGGPYYCAEGQLVNALQRCMSTALGQPDGAALFREAQRLASQGRIDDTANLAHDRVYIFGGTRDDTVEPAVVAEAVDFYRAAGLPADTIAVVDHIGAGHGFVTTDHGVACAATGSPFINDCDYDQAGAILSAIYGELSPPAGDPGGRILEFDQGEFVSQPASHSMNDVGYVYIPTACDGGDAPCRLHVVFHGCRQSTADIGEQFYTRTGYNRWADANGIVILYPQAVSGAGNQNGCWDWWGYDGADYHTRAGTQMAAVKAMVARLAGDDEHRFCDVHTGSSYSHWMAGRAHLCNFWSICANGSNENLGWQFSSVTLYEHPEGTFSTTPCP